jgi:glycosyltransferase involved in cell wall biosynthesis
MIDASKRFQSIKILCLLSSSFHNNQPTTTKRIIPLMQGLLQRGHNITLQENSAIQYAKPGQWRYLPSRINYVAQSMIRRHGNYNLVFGSKAENIPLCYLLSKKLGIPFVLDLDDLEKISALDIHGYGTSLLVRRASKVFVASYGLYQLYKKIANNIVYIPNTTDLEYFNPERYPNNEKSTDPTFFWVSDNIDWVNSCKLIFSSLRKLKKARVIIIGSGPKAYFRELSKKLGIEQRVIVKDWIPEVDLPKLYFSCDFGLLPFSDNLWAQCKCPARLFEFMAMELPYICTVGEPAYMAKKLNCGLIAKPKIEDFTEKMKYAMNHLDELKEGAKSGRKHLLEHQNFNTLSQKLETELLPLSYT